MRGAIALLLVVGCASDPDKPIHAPPPDPGELLMLDLENRLMRAKTVRIVSKLEAEGAVNASLDAHLELGEGQRALLEVSGTFEGKPAKGRLRCDGEKLFVDGKPPIPAPPEIRDAFIIGLTRMGLMHNAALLVGGEAPDHAEGGAHNWVRIERARSGDPATEITFDVVISTKVAGEAKLSLDSEGRPVLRTQKVRFDIGEMTVKERYDTFALDDTIDASVFE
jgi:hypothetical protein